MTPDFPDDHIDAWLEDALRSRPSLTATATFTATVVRQLEAPSLLQTTPWIEEAGRAGLAFAVLGAASIVDISGVTETSGRVLAEPLVLVMAVVALLVTATVYGCRELEN